MNNEKLENLLNLALNATPEEVSGNWGSITAAISSGE